MSRKKLAKARGKERKCIPTEGTAYAKAQRHVKMWCLGNGYNSGGLECKNWGEGEESKVQKALSSGSSCATLLSIIQSLLYTLMYT